MSLQWDELEANRCGHDNQVIILFFILINARILARVGSQALRRLWHRTKDHREVTRSIGLIL
jgi:hypothetical protein